MRSSSSRLNAPPPHIDAHPGIERGKARFAGDGLDLRRGDAGHLEEVTQFVGFAEHEGRAQGSGDFRAEEAP
jgi:hypothetical protein